ncbi:MAG: hypothetical protein ACRDZ8_13055 [Acidimicrobiales bacterium]
MASQLAWPGAGVPHTGAGVHTTLAGEWAGTTGAGDAPEPVEEAEAAEAAAVPVAAPPAVAAVAEAVVAEPDALDLLSAVPTAELEIPASGAARAPTSRITEMVATQQRIKAWTAPRREEGKRPMALTTYSGRVRAR